METTLIKKVLECQYVGIRFTDKNTLRYCYLQLVIVEMGESRSFIVEYVSTNLENTNEVTTHYLTIDNKLETGLIIGLFEAAVKNAIDYSTSHFRCFED